MSMISKEFKTKFGNLHYKLAENYNQQFPTIAFFHGGSPKSQHTEFWNSILPIILNYCNPILIDRFGYGKSQDIKVKIRDHITSLVDLLNHVVEEYSINKLGLIGRSAGSGFVVRITKQIQSKISGLGLIAPGSLKTNIDDLKNFGLPINLLWDETMV